MLRALLVSLALGACTLPDPTFHATPDGGASMLPDIDGGTDHPAVLAIVASATALEVDEGASKDLTVALSQAPSGPLTVALATTATTKLGISTPTLAFTPSNFAEPQTITLSGLSDTDAIDDHADVTLTAAGVDPVTISASIHDVDQVQIIANIASPVTLEEGGTVALSVHLSAQPTGDVAVTALLGVGPVTVAPAMRVFTQANYDVDQVFTFSAPHDADPVAQYQALTLRATGLPDKLLTIHDVDIDVQTILVTPSSATITEQTTQATLDVSLSQQPSGNVTVEVATTSGAAHVNVDSLTFTPQNYATKQHVVVDGAGDADTVDGSDTIRLSATDPDTGGPLARSVAITVHDDDVQQLLEDAPSPLLLSETTTKTFAATLKFKPSANVVVSVVSLDSAVATAAPGTLTFTPANYDQPHTVTVTGAHDGNLVTSTTTVRLSQAALGNTDVAVSVSDVDQQAIVLSATTLTVPEGTTRTFDVSLKFDPGATVSVSLASSNAAALPIDKSTISFTSANFATPVPVTVSPPVDTNATAEIATITVSGGGAATAATVNATVSDPTVVKSYGFGFPTPFSDVSTLLADQVIAYRVTVDATTNLDSFSVFIPAGSGDFTMALYNDASDQPSARIGFMPTKQAITGGFNTANVPDVSLPLGTYWIAFHAAQATAAGFSTAGSGRFCVRNVDIPIDGAWPTNFGSVTCSTDHFMNFFITTYHQ